MRSFQNGGPYGIRTRVSTLRGWCPRPLDEGTCGSSDQMVSHPLTSRPCTGTPVRQQIDSLEALGAALDSVSSHPSGEQAGSGRPGPGLLASWGEPLGRGVTVARLALDQLVQVRILAAQPSPSRVGPRAVAVRAHHIALDDLRDELLEVQSTQSPARTIASVAASTSSPRVTGPARPVVRRCGNTRTIRGSLPTATTGFPEFVYKPNSSEAEVPVSSISLSRSRSSTTMSATPTSGQFPSRAPTQV